MTRVLVCCTLWACACSIGGNRAPVVASVNGVAWNPTDGFAPEGDAFVYTRGEPFTLMVEATDPEGDGLRVWFPGQPIDFDFPPDGLTGTWNVPVSVPPIPPRVLIVQDLHPTEPRTRTVFLPLRADGAATDTGLWGSAPEVLTP